MRASPAFELHNNTPAVRKVSLKLPVGSVQTVHLAPGAAYYSHLDAKREEGPVNGPALPLEAENSNVVIGDIYGNPRYFAVFPSKPFFTCLCDQPCALCAGKANPGFLSLSILSIFNPM